MCAQRVGQQNRFATDATRVINRGDQFAGDAVKAHRQHHIVALEQCQLVEQIAPRFGQTNHGQAKARKADVDEIGEDARWTGAEHKDAFALEQETNRAVEIGRGDLACDFGEILQFHLDDLGQDVSFARFQIGEFALEARGGGGLDAIDVLEDATQLGKTGVTDGARKADDSGFADLQLARHICRIQKDGLIVTG